MQAIAMIIAVCATASPHLPGGLEENGREKVGAHEQAVPAAATPSRKPDRAYYGQRLPGVRPEPFAADVAVALGITRAPVFSADGTEMFWARSIGRFKSVLVSSRLLDAAWTAPAPLLFSTGAFFDHNPALTHDGRRIIFATNRPIEGRLPTTLPGTDVPTSDLWMSERTGTGWSQPAPLGPGVNTEADEDCPVLAADDTLYFSSSRPGPSASPGGILHSKFTDGAFEEPRRLPPPVSDAGEMVSGIAPDETYLLFYSMRPGDAGGLCVSFRQPGGAWGPPISLAPALGGLRAYAASVTLDGRWLFLSAPASTGPGIYWVSVELLARARAGASPHRPGQLGRSTPLM
jgi:hypothetical protein